MLSSPWAWPNAAPLLPPPAASHGQDRPTASVPPLQSAPPGAFLAYPAPAACSGSAHGPSRVGVALGCASASLTPPNVSAASLDADGQRHTVGPGNGSLNNAGLPLSCRLDKDAKVSALLSYETLCIQMDSQWIQSTGYIMQHISA